jgi:hypothetical protein
MSLDRARLYSSTCPCVLQRVVPACTCRVSGNALSRANENGPAEQPEQQQAEGPSCASLSRTLQHSEDAQRACNRGRCAAAERSKQSATQAADQLKAVPSDCRVKSAAASRRNTASTGRVDAANRERASLQMSGGGQSRGLQRTGTRVRARVPAAEHAATHACNTRLPRSSDTTASAAAFTRTHYCNTSAERSVQARLRRLPRAKRKQQRIPLAPSATGTQAACLLATLSWLARVGSSST